MADDIKPLKFWLNEQAQNEICGHKAKQQADPRSSRHLAKIEPLSRDMQQGEAAANEMQVKETLREDLANGLRKEGGVRWSQQVPHLLRA